MDQCLCAEHSFIDDGGAWFEHRFVVPGVAGSNPVSHPNAFNSLSNLLAVW